MAGHPVNDRFKVKVETDKYGLGGNNKRGTESGTVVEVPDILIYFSFHSFAFEDSFMNEDKLAKLQGYYNQFKGKRIFWESFQDRGRRFVEDDGEFVYVQMSDLLFYADSEDDNIILAEDTRSGSFAV